MAAITFITNLISCGHYYFRGNAAHRGKMANYLHFVYEQVKKLPTATQSVSSIRKFSFDVPTILLV
jgi:hypothetical protein